MIEINKYDKYPVDDDFFEKLRTNYYGNKYEKLPDQDRIIETSQRDGMIRPNEIQQLESRSYPIIPGEFLPGGTGYNGNLEVSGASIFNRGKNNGDGKIDDIGASLGSIMEEYETIEPQYNIDSLDPKTQELIRSLTGAKLNHDQPQGSSIRLFNLDNYCESGSMFTTLIDHAPRAFKIPFKLYISLIRIRDKIDNLFSISIGDMFEEPDYKADESSHQYRK